MAGRNTKTATATATKEATVTAPTEVVAPAEVAKPSGRARLKAELAGFAPIVSSEVGDAQDSYILIDAPPIRKGDQSIAAFYVVHRSGKVGSAGDRPVYYATGTEIDEFDFLTMGDFAQYATTKGIPVVAGYYWSLDLDKIEVHIVGRGKTIPGIAAGLKKIRSHLASLDKRWLTLRGLI